MGQRAKAKRARTEYRARIDAHITGMLLEVGGGMALPYDPAKVNHDCRRWIRERYLASPRLYGKMKGIE